MAPKKTTYWVNVYEDDVCVYLGGACKSKEDCEMARRYDLNVYKFFKYVKTVSFDIEE